MLARTDVSQIGLCFLIVNKMLQFKTYLKCSYFYFKFYIVRVLSICLGIKYQNEFKLANWIQGLAKIRHAS